MLRFFVTRANCFCLLHFSHRWLSAFVWAPAGYEWNVWRDEPVFTGCLLLLFVVTSVLLFLVSGFYAYTTNTGEIKKECTILILFLHFHVLPGAFGEKPYTLVLRMWLWISCVHRLFYMSFFFFFTISKSVNMCCSFTGWFVFILFSYWGVNRWCVTESCQEGNKQVWQKKPDETDVCSEASKRNVVRAILFSICWSLLIVLIYCVCIYTVTEVGKPFLAFCSPVHGYH